MAISNSGTSVVLLVRIGLSTRKSENSNHKHLVAKDLILQRTQTNTFWDSHRNLRPFLIYWFGMMADDQQEEVFVVLIFKQSLTHCGVDFFYNYLLTWSACCCYCLDSRAKSLSLYDIGHHSEVVRTRYKNGQKSKYTIVV